VKSPDFILSISDPNKRINDVSVTVEPIGWFTRFIWRFMGRFSIQCTWVEETIKEVAE